MSSESLHESPSVLSPHTLNLHRAIVSLMEELEAVDWYQQRVDATDDKELKSVLAHNRDEEIEHAMMNLEWIRRNSPAFDEAARTYLFSKGPITAVEEAQKAAEAGGGSSTKAKGGAATGSSGGDLGIGSLKE